MANQQQGDEFATSELQCIHTSSEYRLDHQGIPLAFVFHSQAPIQTPKMSKQAAMLLARQRSVPGFSSFKFSVVCCWEPLRGHMGGGLSGIASNKGVIDITEGKESHWYSLSARQFVSLSAGQHLT